MNNDAVIEISDCPEYGAILKCKDVEIADKFEDFLTESCFVLFQIKLEPTEVSFFFGQAGSPLKVRELFERFSDSITKK